MAYVRHLDRINRAKATVPAVPLLLFSTDIKRGPHGTILATNDFCMRRVVRRWIEAEAVTYGSIIIFDSRYRYDTSLMNHELAHVRQYELLGLWMYPAYVSNPGVFEAEAKRGAGTIVPTTGGE